MSELNDIQICSLTGEILGSVKCFEDRNTVPFWWLNSTIEQETQIHRSRRAFVNGVCYRNASRISEGVLCTDRALLTADIPRPVDRCIYLLFEGSSQDAGGGMASPRAPQKKTEFLRF